jgi:5,10-methylene-tetrahydrofolate dehydrogenase/methenyl tetrahydrofolate cyclohydrolase
MPRILDGAAIAAQIKSEVAEEVKTLAAQGITPGLAAVLVGHVPASEIYVRSKVQACADPLFKPSLKKPGANSASVVANHPTTLRSFASPV